MASQIYNEFKKSIGVIDWIGASVKVMLVTSAYVPSIDSHNFKSDIDALTVEIAGTGYVAGGMNLANKAITRDDINDWSVFDADDAIWASSTLTARGAIVYLSTGLATTDTLIAYVDFVTDKSSNAGDFIIQWNTAGVYRLG